MHVDNIGVEKLFAIKNRYLEMRIINHPSNLLITVLIISVLETFFLIRGLFLFDFSKSVFVIYEVAYSVLLICSLAGAIYLFCTIKKVKEHAKTYYILSVLYEAIIIAFSTTVSSLDMIGVAGQSIVYITTILSIPMIALINPYIYSAFAIISTASLLCVAHYCGGFPFASGSIMNYIVLDILVIFTCFTLYHLLESYYKKAETLSTLSITDQLTGLYNRRKLDADMGEKGIEKRNSEAFILCDIDDFKAVNDTEGHAFGDEVLTYVSSQIKEQFGDLTYRYGGDEFAIFTTKSKPMIEEAIEIIKTHLASFSASTPITMSFGIYITDGTEDRITLLRRADKALYSTKGNGKSSYSFFKKQ